MIYQALLKTVLEKDIALNKAFEAFVPFKQKSLQHTCKSRNEKIPNTIA